MDGAHELMNFTNIGDLSGHVIQAGDKLFVRQLVSSGMSAGAGFCFTNANCLDAYPAVTDQNGQSAIYGPGTGNWNYRRIDLSPIAGLTIGSAYVVVIPNSATGSTWHTYYDDYVVQWADGTVHPLYTRESSVATSQGGVGQTNPTATVDTSTTSADVNNPAQTTYYYHGDQIGSSRLMTSGGGWPVWQGTFLPYGEEYNAQIGTNHYKFTGKERDDESGLDYFVARYNSSSLGRFMSPDPLGGRFVDPQTLNKYSYVRNNPINFTDPTGLYTCKGNADQCEKFEAARLRAVEAAQKSHDEKALRGVSVWGDDKTKNGITVTFGKEEGNSKTGEGGTTKYHLEETGERSSPMKAIAEVKINEGLSGAALDAKIGHEGSHIADVQAVASSFEYNSNGKLVYDGSRNITRRDSEWGAYMVTAAILTAEGEHLGYGHCGAGGCSLGAGVDGKKTRDHITEMLNNPNNFQQEKLDKPILTLPK